MRILLRNDEFYFLNIQERSNSFELFIKWGDNPVYSMCKENNRTKI